MSFFDNFSKTNFKKPATIIKIIVAAVIVIALSFAGTYFYMDSVTKVIPDFSSSNIFDVQNWIEENNLTTEQVTITKEYNEEVEVDQVISQSILADNKLTDETLNILVSKGNDPNLAIDLIDFTEMNEADITSWFNDNLFVDVTVEYEANMDIENEKFIRLNVEDTAIRSEMIVITMSVGTKSEGIEINVPDFTDYTKVNIEAWSNTNNIDITYKYAYSDDIDSGKVIMQDPKANTTALTGSEATVTISKGKAVIVSDFIEDKESEITTWASNNGIVLKKLTVYSSITSGLIVSTNPKAKSTISVGSTVQYELSAGLVPLENYVNKTKSSFTTYIEDLNKENNKSAKISIQYKEDSSNTISSGSIISMEFGSSKYDSSSDTELNVNPATSVLVTISTGKAYTVVSKAGSSESEFITYCTDMSLKTYKSATKYDESIASGSIISNETGQYGEGDTVSYVLSKGKYTPVMSDYENKTISSAQSKLSEYISQGASSSWKIVTGDIVTSDNPGGSTVSCSVNNKTITCTISKGKPISVVSYANKTFTEFNNYLNSNGLVLGTKTNKYSTTITSGNIISNDTGDKYAGENINYVYSLGEYIPNYTSYKNKTITEAQSSLASETSSVGVSGYSLNQSSTEYSTSVAMDDIISCTYSNKIVSCKVSLGVEPETPTTFTLGQIKIHEVLGDSDASLLSVQNYIDGQGATDFVNITVINGGEGDLEGSVLSYPAANTYSMLSTDAKLEITIQE